MTNSLKLGIILGEFVILIIERGYNMLDEKIAELEKVVKGGIDVILGQNIEYNIDTLYKLSAILSYLKSAQSADRQLGFMNDSQEVFKNIDFSKIDINSLLQGMMKGEM